MDAVLPVHRLETDIEEEAKALLAEDFGIEPIHLASDQSPTRTKPPLIRHERYSCLRYG